MSQTPSPDSDERIFMMEARNGMIVPVPESKLEQWQYYQDHPEENPMLRHKKEIVDQILDDIYGPDPEPPAPPAPPAPPKPPAATSSGNAVGSLLISLISALPPAFVALAVPYLAFFIAIPLMLSLLSFLPSSVITAIDIVCSLYSLRLGYLLSLRLVRFMVPDAAVSKAFCRPVALAVVLIALAVAAIVGLSGGDWLPHLFFLTPAVFLFSHSLLPR